MVINTTSIVWSTTIVLHYVVVIGHHNNSMIGDPAILTVAVYQISSQIYHVYVQLPSDHLIAHLSILPTK